MKLFTLFVLGTIAFIAISYLEQVPVLGWLGALVSIVGWVTIGRALANEGGPALITSAVLGGWTGLVGSWSAWAFQTGNLFGLSTPGLERVGAGFGFLGATLGLFYWPLVGAGICFLAAATAIGRRLA